MTRRAFTVYEYLLYIIQRQELLDTFSVLFFLSKIDFFDLVTRLSVFTINSNGFFNDSEIHLLLTKFSLEKSIFFRSFPRPFYLGSATLL